MSKNQTIPKSVKKARAGLTLRISQQEYDTILAALRFWQGNRDGVCDETGKPNQADYAEISEAHGPALDDKEIDQFIERIQFDNPAPLHRRYFAIVPSWRETRARTIDVLGGHEKDSAGMDAAVKYAHRVLGKSVQVKLIPVSDTKPNITITLKEGK